MRLSALNTAALFSAALLVAGAAATPVREEFADRVQASYGRLRDLRALQHSSRRSLRGGPAGAAAQQVDDIDALYLKEIERAEREGERVPHDPFKPHHVKTCHPDCGKRGTCDRQFGRCLCPFGFTGPACQEMLLPACRMVNMTLAEAEAMGHSLVLTCASSTHRNCECFRQCWQLYCRRNSKGDEVCQTWRDRGEKCFTYVGMPPDEQLSMMPPANDSDVTYFRGFLPGEPGMQPISREEFEKNEGLLTKLLPLDECEASCSYHGICQTSDYYSPMCSCFHGWEGRNCSTRTYGYQSWCPRDCNGRGTCDRGFCHCRPGWFGLDCSKNTTFQARPQPPYSGHLKVYVYDLPSEVAFQDGYFPGWRDHHEHYLAFWMFLERLLNDTSIRTDDPYEANLFYVPALAYYYSSNTGDAGEHVKQVVSYLKQEYPFWNRTQGRDHVVWIPNDRGSCFFDASEPDLDKIMVVTHFGLHQAPGTKADSDTIATSRRNGCFDPQKDVVAPGNKGLLGPAANRTFGEQGREAFDAPKEVTIMFVGGVREEDLSYSGGVRQEVYHLWGDNNNRPDPHKKVVVYKGYHGRYEWLVKNSKFCLAPYGWGWGIRISETIAQGCVPVIIQDHVYQPLEDVLPYDDFSVRLPKADIPRMEQVLDAISDEEWKRMHDNLRLYWPAFVWDEPYGGKAYEYVVASLRKRVSNLYAGHF